MTLYILHFSGVEPVPILAILKLPMSKNLEHLLFRIVELLKFEPHIVFSSLDLSCNLFISCAFQKKF